MVDVQVEPRSDTFRPVASPWHTVVVLAVIGTLVFRGKLQADQMRGIANPDRIALYERIILSEWLTLGLVPVGVWLKGSSLLTVLGDRWRSTRQFLRDAGIGLLFLIATIAVTSIFGSHGGAGDRATQFLLPRGGVEIALWILVSITASICEEAVYRGYLHRPFRAGIRLGPLVSGFRAGVADRRDGDDERDSGLLAPERASWNDRARAARCAWSVRPTLDAGIHLESPQTAAGV